ncbi:Rik1-associated factor 1 [Pseudocercospora fuligena]|uniref:Rik1-associated factor 1 n=1 Tax=Pseudocercospora fuligena TaxID=685502 RepID=A0A8H6RBT1_9PEZI|nr:Rik1-associated factor 1 [Pseudocercospora fuligena]
MEIIDLTSDAEDESPSKVLNAFKPRKETRKERGQLHKRNVNGQLTPQSNGFGTHSSNASRSQQNGNGSQVRRHTSTIKGASAASERTPPAVIHDLPSGSRTAEKDAASQRGFLSKEHEAALGTPGRRLSMELKDIDRTLQKSMRQSEAERQERVAKANKFQERRVSASNGTSSPLAAMSGANAAKSRDSGSEERTKVQGGFFSQYQSGLKLPSSVDKVKSSSLFGNATVPSNEQRHSGPVLSGPGIAIHRLNHAQPQADPPSTKNGFKRPYPDNHPGSAQFPITKRPRNAETDMSLSELLQHANGQTKTAQRTSESSQPKSPASKRQSVLNDVTDSNFERISYSDEPEPSPLSTSRLQKSDIIQSIFSKLPDLSPNRPSPRRAGVDSGDKFGQEYTAEEDALLKRLKEVDKVTWHDMPKHFEGRTAASLQTRYSNKLKGKLIPASSPSSASTKAPASRSAAVPSQLQPRPQRPSPAVEPQQAPKSTLIASAPGPKKSWTRYSDEDDALIRTLKEVNKLSFEEMLQYFPGRAAGSLSVRYYTKSKFVPLLPINDPRTVPLERADSQEYAEQPKAKRQRRSAPAATDGFVSWNTARSMMRNETPTSEVIGAEANTAPGSDAFLNQDSAHPKSVTQLLRQRETGSTAGRRSWTASRCVIPDELKNHALDDYTLQRFYHGTSGDVVGLSWSQSGKYFAAGSIAITDAQSQQYNMSRNLLVGDNERGELQELPDHHVPRPIISEANNVNALRSMQQSQDPRLFMTVTSTAFSQIQDHEPWLFTAGTDKMLRKYTIKDSSSGEQSRIRATKANYAVEHCATVDLLAMHPDGLVATGCHAAADSIKVFDCGPEDYYCTFTGSPNRSDLQTSAAIFPSALKWGEHPVHRRFLLAGFSGDEDKQLAGETALWNVEYSRREEIIGTTRNVFDVAWNPCPSSASVAFGVASNPSGVNLGRGMRTAIQCFAPLDTGIRRVITWECPALDINDLVFCPHDDNIVAAGATNGKVYIWDKRWAGQHQKPWHTLSHSESLNVLAHDRDREETDTGVRFLSWGATKSRLYSGSSDGIVKVWNPYRAEGNAHISDIDVPRQHRSAVMSGAFCPDYRELLIGTENGRINAFKIGGGAVHKAKQFKLHTAPAPEQAKETLHDLANALFESNTIELRPCGAMPIVQAVQGCNYQGPFLAPSAEQMSQAEHRLRQAQDEQNDVERQLAEQGLSNFETDALKKAQTRVRDAQTAINDLRDRSDFAEISHPKARAFQNSLKAAETERHALQKQANQLFGKEGQQCTLPCAHLPSSEELDDNGRSKLRIPGVLSSTSNQRLAKARLRAEEEAEMCTFCEPHSARPKRGKRTKCITCMLKQLGLSTECVRCSAPARVEAESGKAPLCERCSFTCFRCSQPVAFSPDTSTITCEACSISWEAGVLGYEVVKFPAREVSTQTKVEQDDYDDDFGLLEMERLASRFEVQEEDSYAAY